MGALFVKIYRNIPNTSTFMLIDIKHRCVGINISDHDDVISVYQWANREFANVNNSHTQYILKVYGG